VLQFSHNVLNVFSSRESLRGRKKKKFFISFLMGRGEGEIWGVIREVRKFLGVFFKLS
jgi:hypothetical protein